LFPLHLDIHWIQFEEVSHKVFSTLPLQISMFAVLVIIKMPEEDTTGEPLEL
jgi:hypothetical protein